MKYSMHLLCPVAAGYSLLVSLHLQEEEAMKWSEEGRCVGDKQFLFRKD